MLVESCLPCWAIAVNYGGAMSTTLSGEMKSTELASWSIAHVYRTSGMLAVFSLFLLVEGVIRVTFVTATNHDADWDGEENETFPAVVLLIGALIEVIAGFGGLLRALAVTMFDYRNAAVTRFSVILMLLGWFTFIVFVFAEPAYTVSQADESPVVPLDLSQYKAIVTLGILGSLAYCGALQGGQVFFAWQLWMTEKGDSAKYNVGYYASRLVYYSVFAAIGGVSQLAIGILVRAEVGEGLLMDNERVGAPPYFIVYPDLSIAAGILVTFASCVGLVRALVRNESGRGFFSFLWALTWLVQILFMAATQLGLWDDGTILSRRELVFVSGQLVVLTLALSVLPPYMDAMMHHNETKARGTLQSGSV